VNESAKKLLPVLLILSNAMAACSSSPTRLNEIVHADLTQDLPQPASNELADLKSLLLLPGAPRGAMGEFADTCADDLPKDKLKAKAAALNLVKYDSAKMHWCFYSKLARLESTLQTEANSSSRQKRVNEQYSFLAPLATAFLELHSDSRYLTQMSQYYSQISEWVFFKKATPQSMLADYGIKIAPALAQKIKAASPTHLPASPVETNRAPASVIEEEPSLPSPFREKN
jgi:hypothetical protein